MNSMYLKKQALTAAALILTVVTQKAAGDNVFVGAEIGYLTFSKEPSLQIGKRNPSPRNLSPKDPLGNIAASARIGTEVNKNARAYVVLGYANLYDSKVDGKDEYGDPFTKRTKITQWQFGVHVDVQHEVVRGLKLFAGPHIGLSKQNISLTSRNSTTGEVDKYSFSPLYYLFGLQLGANYSLHKNFSAEAGYRYSLIQTSDEAAGLAEKGKLGSLSQAYLAVNYHF